MENLIPALFQFIGGCAHGMASRAKASWTRLAPLQVPFAVRQKSAAEAYGVFLPAAGNRNGTSVNNVGSNGNYWSSSYNNSNNAYNLNFNSGNVNPNNNNNRYNGFSVRIVSENCFMPASSSPFRAFHSFSFSFK